MIIPLGTDRPLQRRTILTYVLIAVNVAVFMALWAIDRRAMGAGQPGTLTERTFTAMGFVWNASEWWRLVTYAFLHGSWMHLIGNMLTLWVFGPNVEDRLGRFGFSVLYLAGSAAGALAHKVSSDVALIGASGAVATVTGAYLILFPRTHIKTFVFFVFVGVYQIPALWYIGFSIAKDILWLGADQGVSHAAHVGGYMVGAAVSLFLLGTKILPREMFDAFSLLHRKQRLKEIRDAADLVHKTSKVIIRSDEKRARLEEQPIPEEILTQRADIAARLARGDVPGAGQIYRGMVARLAPPGPRGLGGGVDPRWLTLNRHHMLTLAEHFYAGGDYAGSAAAYDLFIRAYPQDPQHARSLLMAGLIQHRYLDRSAEADTLIRRAMVNLQDTEEIEMARAMLAEIQSNRASRSDTAPPYGASERTDRRP